MTHSHAKNGQKVNWALLAGLRFFLAWVVMATHLPYFTGNNVGFLSFFMRFGGKAAVIGFLLVSGYSIAASLQRSTQGFYRRRFVRIYPLYFMAVVAALVLQILLGERMAPGFHFEPSSPATVAGNFLLLQTFLVRPIGYNELVWSLSVEFSYYLLAPFLPKKNTNVLFLLILVSGAASLIPRSHDWGLLIFLLSKFNALRYLWAWLIGFAVYRERCPWILFSLGAFGAGLTFVNNPEQLAVLTFLLSFLLILFSGHVSLPPTFSKVFDYLGNLSYPLYLFQIPCMVIAYFYFGVTNPWLLFTISIVSTMVLYRIIDVDFKRSVFVPLLEKLSAWRLGWKKRSEPTGEAFGPLNHPVTTKESVV